MSAATGPTLADLEAQPEGRLLSAAEEQHLGRLLRGEDPAAARRARDLLILRNRRLVWAQVGRYLAPGLDRADLEQEGILGLMRAVDLWDPARGLKLSTYATIWVRQHLQRYLDGQMHAIRLPTHLEERRRRVRRTAARLTAERGRAPTDEELAAAARCTPAQLAAVRRAEELTLVASLDRREGDDDPDGRDGHELLADAGQDVEALALAGLARATVAGWLAQLDPRSRRIIGLRYGLGDEEPQTLEQVGHALKLTRERVRQLEHAAMATLRRIAAPHAAAAAD